MAAKKSSNIIDHSIINQFSETLKILNIKTEDIERNIYNFSLPKIDKATIKKLSSTGIIMEKGFDIRQRAYRIHIYARAETQ